ncbi:leucine-rich repeat-containing protein 17-like [Osmerus mordax]|uniref:leucine-rich repeat-containing protein 17-like n=1 Tax=Osmerus mordax TaxID=8014 RepID=UPI00350FB8C8
MLMSSPLLLVLLGILLLEPCQLKRAGRGGRGYWGIRLRPDSKALRAGRQGRAGAHRRAGVSDCSEFTESQENFLDCQERYLGSIPATFSWAGRQPHHLLLARNRIKVLRDGAFSEFSGLKSLDLQQNQLVLVEEGAFTGLTHLTTLLLQHNRLSTLGEEALIPLPALRHLRLHDNPWNCRCPLESLVRTLQVPSNRYLGNHARCEEPAWLKGRKLRQVDPELLCVESDPTPETLVDLPAPIPLRTRPDATSVCHTYLFPKPRLDCKSRGLMEVPIEIPEDAIHIDLSHNAIHHLRAREFLEARSLRTLNLSSNNLEHIHTASLSGLLHLRELDLSNNKLLFFQYGVLEDLYFLSLLQLGGNPWVCDYNIHYMVYWLRLHPRVSTSGLLCHSPPEHSGKSVGEYVHSYNRACPKDRDQNQDQNQGLDQTDPELWNTALELQAVLEEEEEPAHLRAPQKYQIIRLT